WSLAQMLRERADMSPRLLSLLVPAIALPHIANAAGWIFTEIGRQPWIVFGLQRTADGVSPNVGTAQVALSLAVFTLLYGALMVADGYLLAKYARAGLSGTSPAPEETSVPAAAAVF